MTLALSACGDETPVRFTEIDATPAVDVLDAADPDAPVSYDTPAPLDRGTVPTDMPIGGMTVVYAHSDSALFSVDPSSRAVRMVGMFRFPTDGNNHSMTDLAVNADGEITGVTQDALYRIDPDTAGCTLIRSLPATDQRVFVGLTWVPVGVLDPAREVLLGGATDGTLWRIDPSTGRTASVGALSSGWGISGDMVSIAGAATYATVRRTTGTSTADTLVTLTFTTSGTSTTARMTTVGTITGYQSIYGLGYWRSTLYGFTRAGHLITINVRTGAGTDVSMPTMQFSGAGVTTVAPVAPP